MLYRPFSNGSAFVGATLVLASGLFILWQGSACSVIYSGCAQDSDCNEAIGEICVKWDDQENGECGFPDDFCQDGATRECQGVTPDDNGELPGACAGQVETCVGGEWQPCTSPETCNGIDDDCNGVVDNGVEGVGEMCAAGEGVCEAAGITVCSPAGEVMCDAMEGMPTEPACDCTDNNCDGATDEFQLETLNSTAPSADHASWTIGSSNGVRLAAWADPMSSQVQVVNLSTGASVGTFPGRQPKIAGRTNGGVVVFYIDDDMLPNDPDPPIPFAEVYYREISNGALGMPVCLTCGEQGREGDGQVLEFEAVYAGCTQITDSLCNDGIDNDGDGLADIDDPECERSFLTPSENGVGTYCDDGIDNDKDRIVDSEDAGCLDTDSESSCGFLTIYVREDLQTLHSARLYDKTLAVQPMSIGPLLPYQDTQGVSNLQVAMNSPSSAFIAYEEADGSIGMVLALATSLTQTQSKGTVLEGLAGPVEFSLSSLESNNAAIFVWGGATGVEAQVLRPDPEAPGPNQPPGFLVDVGPSTISDAVNVSPEVVWTCPERALVAVENAGAEGTDIQLLQVDPTSLMVTDQTPMPVPGAAPRLLRDPIGAVVFGALTSDSPIAPGGNGSPAGVEIVCDE